MKTVLKGRPPSLRAHYPGILASVADRSNDHDLHAQYLKQAQRVGANMGTFGERKPLGTQLPCPARTVLPCHCHDIQCHSPTYVYRDDNRIVSFVELAAAGNTPRR